MKRPCLDCGVLTDRTRCLTHTRAADRRRVARRGNLYDRAWRTRAAQQIVDEPWCALCGSERDLTADHLVPGDMDSELRTLCRPCNSARANRMPRVGVGR